MNIILFNCEEILGVLPKPILGFGNPRDPIGIYRYPILEKFNETNFEVPITFPTKILFFILVHKQWSYRTAT